mmetsp:Transcript_148303/g.369706  ORF Transcript_148303/g.369706 Transcript_148303/m.369706 type:complete len:185 (-) Transcript_148303:126-680(-)
MGGVSVPRVPEDDDEDFLDIVQKYSKKTCTWRRLKFYVIPTCAMLAVMLSVGAVFPNELKMYWPWILLAASGVFALAVALASKFEVIYNEVLDIKYTLQGLHEILKLNHKFCRAVGKFVDKTEPQLEKAQEFMESFKKSIEPAIEDMQRIIAKIEKPIEAGVSDIKDGILDMERGIEKALKHVA